MCDKHCSFSVLGPTTWNGHPSAIQLLPKTASSQINQLLKTFFSEWLGSRAPLGRDPEVVQYIFLLIDL